MNLSPGSDAGRPGFTPPDFICVGSAHWDILGKCSTGLRLGQDVPGTILRRPGGVALTVANAIGRLGKSALLCSIVGNDRAGSELIAEIAGTGLPGHGILKLDGQKTDQCAFIEDGAGIVTGVSDCQLLEAESDRLVSALAESSALRADPQPMLMVDGNLSAGALRTLAEDQTFAGLRMGFVVASDGKAERAMAFLRREQVTLYLNKAEAEKIAGQNFSRSDDAAGCLAEMGFARVIVSDSARGITDCDNSARVTAIPEDTRRAVRFLGAGDNLVAGHLVAECDGHGRRQALNAAMRVARNYVTGDVDR